MKNFLNIALIVFLAVVVFNASLINYKLNLTHEPNDKFLYSGLVAVLGILVVFIIKQLRVLSKK
ncbi:hypothetical protein O2K51_12570 [Apibacter raozihei]|uniref:hypothetical protein n=1 Tax=Apibacter TaxID=1778601 RepID=UPI000FE345CE|nr:MULTISPECIES: hypothetical protein [Apibacter]